MSKVTEALENGTFVTECVNLYATDGTYIDYYERKLDNMEIFLLIGRLLSIGYFEPFSIEVAGTDIWVARMEHGQITVNWKVVRILDESEWKARNA